MQLEPKPKLIDNHRSSVGEKIDGSKSLINIVLSHFARRITPHRYPQLRAVGQPPSNPQVSESSLETTCYGVFTYNITSLPAQDHMAASPRSRPFPSMYTFHLGVIFSAMNPPVPG